MIEQRLGCSIREFFEREGEPAFRAIELEVIADLTRNDQCVISTGGGVVLHEVNRDKLRTHCKTVYLHCEPEEIFRRLRHDQNRPLLQVASPLEKLKDLYTVRDPLYREAAHLVVQTGRPSIAALVSTIIEQLQLSTGPHLDP